MSSLDLEPQPRVMRFPGGDVVKARPSREQLEESLQAWSALAVQNAIIVRDNPSAANIRGLRSNVETLERALQELEAASG